MSHLLFTTDKAEQVTPDTCLIMIMPSSNNIRLIDDISDSELKIFILLLTT